jgi:hypothetical protein
MVIYHREAVAKPRIAGPTTSPALIYHHREAVAKPLCHHFAGMVI